MGSNGFTAVAFGQELQQPDLLAARRVGESHAPPLDLHAPHIPECHGIVSIRKGDPPAVELAGNTTCGVRQHRQGGRSIGHRIALRMVEAQHRPGTRAASRRIIRVKVDFRITF